MKVKIKFFLMFGLFLIGMPKADATSTSLLEEYIEGKYKLLDSNGYALPGYDLFERGIIGYLNLKESNSNLKKDLLTVIDFRTSSKNRRLEAFFFSLCWLVMDTESPCLNRSLVSRSSVVASCRRNGTRDQ